MLNNRNRTQSRTTLHYGKLIQGSSSDPTIARLRQQFLDTITTANPQIVAGLSGLLPLYREAKNSLHV